MTIADTLTLISAIAGPILSFAAVCLGQRHERRREHRRIVQTLVAHSAGTRVTLLVEDAAKGVNGCE